MRYLVCFLLYVLLGMYHTTNGVAVAAVSDQKELVDTKRLRVHPTNAGDDNADEAQLLEGDTLNDKERGFLNGIMENLTKLRQEATADQILAAKVKQITKKNEDMIERLYDHDMHPLDLRKALKLPNEKKAAKLWEKGEFVRNKKLSRKFTILSAYTTYYNSMKEAEANKMIQKTIANPTR